MTDKSWSGYNWYQGNYRSLIQINTDLPIYIDRAIDLACHEGYPGHHVYNVLLEQQLVRGRGWQEFTVYPLFSPQSLIAEGTANYGIEVAFPDDERRAFERDVLFPAAGLDASQVEQFYEIAELVEKLGYAGNEAARRYRDGQIDAAAAASWLETYALSSPERAAQRVRFIDQYGAYVINYNLGKDLVATYLEARAGADPEQTVARVRSLDLLAAFTVGAQRIERRRRYTELVGSGEGRVRSRGLLRGWAAALAVCAALQAAAQPLPIENIQLRGDRFRGLHYREMTEEQRALLYNVVNSARAVTNTTGNGPFNTLLRTPQVGELSQQLGNAIRFSSGLSGRLREMATLMAGRAWTSSYEWYAHARYALDEGIEPSVVAAIAEHRTPDLAAMPVEDAMVWRVADEILYTRRVTDDTYREALAVLGERRLLSSATIAAYYEYVSMLLNVDRYPLPADAPAEAAAAAHGLRPLPADALYRKPQGAVTPRPAIPNEDTERAIAALGASVERDDELPRARARRSASCGAGAMEQAPPVTKRGAHVAGRRSGRAVRNGAARYALRLGRDVCGALDALGERGLVNLMVLMGHSNIRCAQQALAGAACVL